MSGQKRLQGRNLLGLFLQNDLPNYRIYILVRQLNADGETGLQPLQRRGARQRRLAGGDKE